MTGGSIFLDTAQIEVMHCSNPDFDAAAPCCRSFFFRSPLALEPPLTQELPSVIRYLQRGRSY